jgi:hypothetical protein
VAYAFLFGMQIMLLVNRGDASIDSRVAKPAVIAP